MLNFDSVADTALLVALGVLTWATWAVSQADCRQLNRGQAGHGPMDRNSGLWHVLSDIVQYSSLLLPFVWLLGAKLQHQPGVSLCYGWSGVLRTAGVVVQALLAANVLTHMLKLGAGRPRPKLSAAVPLGPPAECYRSFPSGHVTMAAAGLASWNTCVWLLCPVSSWRYPALVASGVWLALGAYSRIAAGLHFVSDVLAGAALGALLGAGVPLVHHHRICSAPKQFTAASAAGLNSAARRLCPGCQSEQHPLAQREQFFGAQACPQRWLPQCG